MRLYKINALFKLGMEDLTKNMSIFIYVLLPLMMALLYSAMGYTGMLNFSMSIVMNLGALPVMMMGTIVAEEKEKNTLRTLMLNDVKALEILIAKAFICLVFVIINNVIIFFICEIDMGYLVAYQLLAAITGLGIVLFGAVVGLLAKNQMSASLYGMPLFLVFLAPIFLQFFENEVAQNISRLIVTDAMLKIMDVIAAGEVTFENMWLSCVVIVAWTVVSGIVFQIAYKKVGTDN